MHVPEENLLRYRNIMNVVHMFDRAAGIVSGHGEHWDANTLWALAAKYRARAQELRVPGKDGK